MFQLTSTKKPVKITCPNLSLTKYREIAAHLQQVEGVEAELIAQTSSHFDYRQSQIEALLLSYTEDFLVKDKERVEEILSYYAEIHGNWLFQ